MKSNLEPPNRVPKLGDNAVMLLTMQIVNETVFPLKTQIEFFSQTEIKRFAS